YGMNQDAGGLVVGFGLTEQTGLPIGEVGGEEIYGEGGGLLGGPIFGDGPDEVAMRHRSFCEGAPLHVAHHAAFSSVVSGKFASGKFASGRERRFGRAGVSAARGQQIGEVQATRL